MKTLLAIATILILCVLSVLFFSGMPNVSARKKSKIDTNRAYNLKNAIAAYFTEHRKFPINDSSLQKTIEIDSDHRLMQFLIPQQRSFNEQQSPRNIQFYADKTAKQTRDKKWVNGIRESKDGSIEVFDNYGNNFRISIDLGISRKMISPDSKEPIPETVLVWSAGKDGNFDTWDDNPKTW